MWLKECEESHDLCKESCRNSDLPQRVLDVSEDHTVKLISVQGRKGAYITLSNTWGTDAKYLLTATNKASLETGIPENTLPRTFMHAVQLERCLGISYLWIDALCIQQDSPHELDEQIAKMNNIFRRSSLTLFAGAGGTAHSGLEVMNKRGVLPVTVNIKNVSGSSSIEASKPSG
ncbi:hypothetical protein K458DRAFT_307726 [Lentithecium fluviatile CBS 122367]|uniref:Heterokaryon incompatibility domain-containing protein n=1 Tax=Lentithecium fluviatile CBS 122367 TaxID=1168545 RepID=A0A6G1IWC5_9PLEO|nr:hypothetical protein K458DRAFT_307726 [Lentithecium fluviatile CBS 122367]